MNSWIAFWLICICTNVVLSARSRNRNVWGTTGYRFNDHLNPGRFDPQHKTTTRKDQCPIICRAHPGIPGIPGLDGEDGLPGIPGNPGQKGEPGLTSIKTKEGQIITGQKGEPGSPGIQGPAKPGQKGDRGQRGLRGYRGMRGEPGKPGSPGTASPSKVMVFANTEHLMETIHLDIGTLAYVIDTQSLWVQSTSGFVRLAIAPEVDQNTIDSFPVRA